MADSLSPRLEGRSDRVAGLAVAAATILSLVAIAFHPSVARTGTPEELVRRLVAFSTLDEIVHGTLILAVAGLLYGMAAYSLRRGMRSAGVLAGLVTYALGAAALVGAGLIDGFMIPMLAVRTAAEPAATAAALQILTVLAIAIGVLTKFGLAATCLAMLCWAAGLVRTAGRPRITGIAGIASALAVAALLTATRQLNPHALAALFALQAVWYVAVASELASPAPGAS